MTAIADRLSTHMIGNPLDPQSRQGTIVSERRYRNIPGLIERAVQAGARIVSGGLGQEPAGAAYSRPAAP